VVYHFQNGLKIFSGLLKGWVSRDKEIRRRRRTWFIL